MVCSNVEMNADNMKINVAEFLAALITCETFAPFCKNTLTKLQLDNYSAKSWLDSSRCPRYPFDRCAQGANLYMLQCSIKIKTEWIPSAANTLPYFFSRTPLSRSSKGHVIFGSRMIKVKPLWFQVSKFL